jgi:pyrimidine deaminase RibD-like protein
VKANQHLADTWPRKPRANDPNIAAQLRIRYIAQMSAKKELSKASDRNLMVMAIDLARKCKSEPRNISPKVGAIAARDGRVLGDAFRGELAPGEHAEFPLLEGKLADQTLAGATLFTTLEPCTSRNHPKIACADRIIERRIKRVVIGVLDPQSSNSRSRRVKPSRGWD